MAATLGVDSVFGADVDGDGDLDVLSGGDKIAWYENTDGVGGFGAQQAQEADSDHGTSVGCLRFPQGFEGARDGVVDFDTDCVVVVDTNPQGATATAAASSCDTPCHLNVSEITKTITITKEERDAAAANWVTPFMHRYSPRVRSMAGGSTR